VPLDGSTRGNWALNLGASLAQANGAELLLVHVVARPELLQGAGAPGDAERLAERLVEANRKAAGPSPFFQGPMGKRARLGDGGGGSGALTPPERPKRVFLIPSAMAQKRNSAIPKIR
jgi:hypothetical protein